MTAPHTGPATEAPDLDAALAALRSRGLRVSTARRLTMEALYASDGPLTAEQVAERSGSGADVASVYRNLETLEQVGLVRHFHLGHSPGLYVPTGAGVREYLVCNSCRRVRPVEPGELDGVRAELQERFGWDARFTHTPIAGLCGDCSGEGA